MEPLDENELSQLLRRWEAPSAPLTLRGRLFPRRTPWWRWLLTGTIRIPVPVGVAVVFLMGLWIYYSRPEPPARVAEPPSTVSLEDFQPVRRLEPVVVMGVQK